MFDCQDRMQQEEDRAIELVRSGYTNTRTIDSFSTEELEKELQRRKNKDTKLEIEIL